MSNECNLTPSIIWNSGCWYIYVYHEHKYRWFLLIELNLIWLFNPMLVTKQLIGHISIWFDYQQEEKEELSSSSIDTVFPSDWGTYGDLACHKLAFFTIIHLFFFWDMFKNTFQSGFLSILYSIGSKPLQIWDKKVSWLFQFNRISLSLLF